MKPSLFKQIEATEIDRTSLKESPRHWNCGLLRYKGRLWLSYRYHLKEHQGRIATAICELDQKTLQPIGRSQQLKLSGPTGTEHHEDARLFLFRGEPMISYTEMRGYRPNVDYTCIIKYAQLKLRGAKWEVVKVWHPQYGHNDGRAKEKNWVFFEYAEKLHAVYSAGHNHQVIELDGHKMVQVYETPGPVWHFGPVRGGSPPVKLPDGTMMAMFHSSVPTEAGPHYVRYFSGCYCFDGKPPFTPTRISMRPLMVGSEEDGHGVNQLNPDSWKPWVVFPCGLLPDGDRWLCSLGVNDWKCAIATIRSDQLYLGAANGSDIQPRFFRSQNGSLPVKFITDTQQRQLLHWTTPHAGGLTVSAGYMKCLNPREAQAVADCPKVDEITFDEYARGLLARR